MDRLETSATPIPTSRKSELMMKLSGHGNSRRTAVRIAALGAGLALVPAAAVGLSDSGRSSSAAPAKTAALPLEDPTFTVVYSGPDKDAQIIFTVGSKSPMSRLSMTGPNGLSTLDVKFADAGHLGQADLRLDSPEPTLAKLKQAYPAGIYRLSGKTVGGRALIGRGHLSYGLLPAPVITSPAPGAAGVTTQATTMRWKQVPGAKFIHLELEQVRTHRLLTVDLDGDATSLVIPPGFMKPGLKYTFDVKAAASNGNLSVADVTFRTAA